MDKRGPNDPDPLNSENSDVGDRATREKSKLRQRRWSIMLRTTAELSAVVSIIAFGVSCIINSMVFSQWRHNFLQIATPSDVIMSGTSLLGQFFVPLFLAVLATLAGILFIYGVSLFDDRKAGKWRLYWTFAGILYKILAGFFIFGWGFAFYYAISQRYYLDGRINLSIGLFMVSMAWIILSGIWSDGRIVMEEFGDALLLIYGILSVPSGLLLVTNWFNGQISELSNNGFHYQRLQVLLDGKDVCGGDSRLLWSGSQTDLVECLARTDGRIVIALRNSQNVTYIIPAPSKP